MLVSENWFLFISFTIGLVFEFVLNKRKGEIEIENYISPLECHVENDENVISTSYPPPPYTASCGSWTSIENPAIIGSGSLWPAYCIY